MNVKDLSKPLTRSQIEFRVGTAGTKDGQGWITILAYKDARTDMEMLDNAVGAMNWTNEYKRDTKGVLQCGIGIYSDETPSKGFVWKWSNGTPSEFESAKGEYSDAFKRAGFMWGIGRQLYDFPRIFVYLNEKDEPKKVRPNEWIWEISEDYQDIKCYRKYGNTKKIVFNSKPY